MKELIIQKAREAYKLAIAKEKAKLKKAIDKANLTISGKDIDDFFLANPNLKVKSIIKELPMSEGTFYALRNGTYAISKENEIKIKNLFRKYKFKINKQK